MAANPYYDRDAHSHADAYHTYTDLPGTPLPPQHMNNNLPSDRTYPFLHRNPSSNYASSGRFPDDDLDPYDDRDSIPLNGRKPKFDTSQRITPIPPHQGDDLFVRDIDPAAENRARNKGGWFSGKITWVVYFMTLVQVVVFVAEIIKSAVLTKSPIEIHPSFNPMIGPSPYVLINMGSRYQPCMHNMVGVQDSATELFWPCPNATATTGASVSCSLSELCGLGGVPDPHVGGNINEQPAPDQWWRFIIPIFIHAGIVHIGFNLLLQLTLGRDVERLIGSIRFALVYLASGIFGFILGGNFAGNGIASCGCSGSLFGILAITLLDLLYTWKQRPSPWRDLIFIVVDVVIALVLGLLPGLDNFSHIGGFIMGLVLGVCILRSPSAISTRASHGNPLHPYYDRAQMQQQEPGPTSNVADVQAFVRAPLAFFRDRRPVWWAWTVLRLLALVGILIAFILLLKNFYVWRRGCKWCKYLSCLDINVGGTNWCDVGDLNFTPQNNSSSS